MGKEIKINGIEYTLIPKIVLTDDEFITYVLTKEKVEFTVDDIVWFKGESIRKECGDTKFKVLSFEPYHLLNGIRVDSYLRVNLESLQSRCKTSFTTTHLEKCENKTIKEIIIDGIEYELIPK